MTRPEHATPGLRVLHVHSGNLFGGVETLMLTLAERSAAVAGLVSEFALCFPGRLSRELEAMDAPVHELGPVRARYPRSLARARARLKALVREQRYDVAFFHSPWAIGLFSGVTRAAGLPAAYYLHGEAQRADALEWWASLHPPDLAFCNSEFTAGTLPRLFPGVPSEVLRYPIADRGGGRPEDRAAVREEVGAGKDDVVIVQVSRMEEWKGHRLHLEALARLRDLAGWVCWQVGGAQRPAEVEYLRAMQALAAELGLSERVRFLGERPDVPRLLAAADIHCQPNLGPEPFGITFIEALYARLPVVTTAIGAAPEIVTPACGVLVPPADPVALAGALARLIGDDEARRLLGAAGPARAAELCDPVVQTRRLHDALLPLARSVAGR